MTTLKDILRDFAGSLLTLKADQPEGESIPQDDLDALINNTVEDVKERLIG